MKGGEIIVPFNGHCKWEKQTEQESSEFMFNTHDGQKSLGLE